MVLAFGPKSREKREKPLTLPPGAQRRGAPGGRGDGRSGGRGGGRGGGGDRGGGRGVPPPPASGPDKLQRLAAGVQRLKEGISPATKGRYGRQAAAPAPAPHRQPRHLQSAVGELLGGPAQPAAQEESWGSQSLEAAGADMLPYLPPQQPHYLPQPLPQAQARELPPPRAARSPSPPAASEAHGADFTRRDAARLGGDGVAGIFGGAGGAGAVSKSGGYMAALSSIKPGLSDAQKAKQAAQREQLKRELEEQIQEKRASEARRKAELAAREEEERKLRAYWAAQAAQAASEREGTAGRQNAAAGNGVDSAQHGGGAAAAPAPAAKGRTVRAQGAAEPLGAAASNSTPSKRGEALVQPGVTVFLPPDRAAERRGALRARQQSEACSQDAEAVQPLPAGGSDWQTGQAPAAVGAGAAVAAWRQLQELAGSQYPAAAAALLPQQLAAAALLAAANPAMVPGGLPQFLYSPALLSSLAAGGVVAGAGAAQLAPQAADAADPQVLALLRELQQEQRRMREQLEAVAGDATEARCERNRARQDLERVQRLLAERQAGQQQGWAGMQGASLSSDGSGLAVTSHVLPLGAARIPSRLGSPAAPGGVQQEVAGAPLPARYRQQPIQPWQNQEQRVGADAMVGASTKQAGGGTKQAGKRQGWGQPGAGLQAKGKPGPAGTKQGLAGVKQAPVWGRRK